MDEALCAGHTRSNPGGLPLEPIEQLQYEHPLHKGVFLVTGVEGRWQATGSECRSRICNEYQAKDCLILQNPFLQTSNHPINDCLSSTL